VELQEIVAQGLIKHNNRQVDWCYARYKAGAGERESSNLIRIFANRVDQSPVHVKRYERARCHYTVQSGHAVPT
jgi:hypothetical protein